MEQTRHGQTICTNQQPEEWAKLIRKLRWIGMDEEAHHLQMAGVQPASARTICCFGGTIQYWRQPWQAATTLFP